MFRRTIFVCIILILGVFAVGNVLSAPKPLVYFTFDKLDANIPDASGNGNDGEVKGGVALSDDGKMGKSFEFNGQDSYVDIERVVQDNFTLMSWIKTDVNGLGGNQAYQGTGLIWSDVGGAANDYILALLTKKLSFFCGSPDLSVTSDTDVVIGDWVHVAGVRDLDNGKISVFVNGKHDKTIDHGNAGSLDSQPRIHIGANTLDSRYYTGLMDEVKIFDVALTEAEIQEAMGSGEPVESKGKLTSTWAEIKISF